MSTIMRIMEKDFNDFVNVTSNTYPAFKIVTHISVEKYIDTINKLFMVEDKPVCMTAF